MIVTLINQAQFTSNKFYIIIKTIKCIHSYFSFAYWHLLLDNRALVLLSSMGKDAFLVPLTANALSRTPAHHAYLGTPTMLDSKIVCNVQMQRVLSILVVKNAAIRCKDKVLYVLLVQQETMFFSREVSVSK